MENKMDISRRGFIGTVAGAGALAAFGLAGCAPKAAADAEPMADTGAVEGADAASDWLGVAPEISEGDIVATKECDLLIVGAGNGGTGCRGLRGRPRGRLHHLREGRDRGRHAPLVRGSGHAPFKDQGVEVDRQRLMGEIVRYSQGNCDQRLIRMWMDESNDMFEFVDSIMTASGAVVIADEFDMPAA